MTDITLAIDAMSGDLGASVVLDATSSALNEDSTLRILLVGRRSELEASPFFRSHHRLMLVDAPDVVHMHERPAHAMRRKQASSMAVALQLVRDDQAQACVSAGNTGALMALGRLTLRTFPGIDRPAIVKCISSLRGKSWVLDLGANVDTSAEHLYQFAILGSILAATVDGLSAPRVALLNVGAEEIKGNEQVRLAAHLLSQCKQINYVGYVEGSDIFRDVADVVVCDGFVGNVALKTGEGVARMLIEILDRALTQSWYARFIGFLARPITRPLFRLLDPANLNGATLLGLQGVVVKSHGNANERAFLAAIRQAAREARLELPQRINRRLDESGV